MTIKVRPKFQLSTIAQLTSGTVFTFSPSSGFYLKVVCDPADYIPCVNLSSGILTEYLATSEVYPIHNAVLTISDQLEAKR